MGSEIVEVGEEAEHPPELQLRFRASQDDDDLDQLLRAIDMTMPSSSAASRARAPSQKRTARVTPRASGVGASESVSLKQALRRICISQASELAAMKRLSMSNASPCHSEASTIKRLYASLVTDGRRADDEKSSLAAETSKDSNRSSQECAFRTARQSQCTSLHSASSSSAKITMPDAAATDDEEKAKLEPPAPSEALQEPISSTSELTECSTSKEKEGECSGSSKSSTGDYSTSTSITDDSVVGIAGTGQRRPHMSGDARWAAICSAADGHGGFGLDNFKLLARLGCGDIGTVYLAELVGSGCLFAVKVMDVEYLVGRKKMLRAQTEREILRLLDHPFLPTLFAHFTADNLSCLVMEYCPGGDLHVLRQKQPGRCFTEPAARFYVAEVLLALEYLHMLGVIYRDLKPENILVREDGHIMLSDFDLSLRCSVSPFLVSSGRTPAAAAHGPCSENSCIDPFCLAPPASCFASPDAVRAPRKVKAELRSAEVLQLVAEPTEARSNSFVGTHEYLAPEIIRGDGHGSAVDWWTFGIFLYELLYGRTPFKGLSNDDTLANVVSQSLRFPENPGVSSAARDLIRRLLVKDPECRLGSARGAAEIKQHPFFEGLNWALIRSAVPPDTPDAVPTASSRPAQSRRREGRCLDFQSSDGGGGDSSEFSVF